jgi:hypothetical protein
MLMRKVLKKFVSICVRKLCNGFHNRYYFQIVIGLNLPWGAELVPNEKKLSFPWISIASMPWQATMGHFTWGSKV